MYHAVKPQPHKVTDLYVDYDEEEDRIWICHPNDGRLLYYDQDNINEIKGKYLLQYNVHATEKMINGYPHFDIISIDALTTTMLPFTVKSCLLYTSDAPDE